MGIGRFGSYSIFASFFVARAQKTHWSLWWSMLPGLLSQGHLQNFLGLGALVSLSGICIFGLGDITTTVQAVRGVCRFLTYLIIVELGLGNLTETVLASCKRSSPPSMSGQRGLYIFLTGFLSSRLFKGV